MSDWAPKRFWTNAAAQQTDTGWGIALDGRSVRTPVKTLLTVSTEALAARIAAEWDAQEEVVDPGNMPFTRLANSALDKVAVQYDAVARVVADYGGSDLLCYRADEPSALAARQAAGWDPLLAWAGAEYGITLNVQTGLMPVLQPEASLARALELTRALGPEKLTGFHDLVALTGSWVMGYAALTEHATTDALWTLSHIDEQWQEEQWGADEDALAARAVKRAAFQDAFDFVKLCGGYETSVA